MTSAFSIERANKKLQIRRLEIVAAILLSIAALGTSWSGYQAARWSGVQATNYSLANAKRVESNQASTAAGQLQAIDVQLFTQWLNAYATNNSKLEQFYHSRFRPEFLPAFEVWLDGDPLNNAKAASSPFALPQYKLSMNAQAENAEAEAVRIFKEGQAANQQSDDYILDTVTFSMVLFLVSISGVTHSIAARKVLLCVAALMCVAGIYRLFEYPIY